ncbi:hypothetical protein Acr_06g0007820 [Actinidia rufa]|uniref:DUF4283 domain-containing protein n=1 Tax=Actinidia rufa TaxID=165716 RepID=A0A7J0ER79_9ERIC|nr:hypothetical protein Acr_06g0007820 [Actinidia rufa]
MKAIARLVAGFVAMKAAARLITGFVANGRGKISKSLERLDKGMVGHSRPDRSITPVCDKLVVMSSLVRVDAVREGVDLRDQIASKPLQQVWERESGSDKARIRSGLPALKESRDSLVRFNLKRLAKCIQHLEQICDEALDGAKEGLWFDSYAGGVDNPNYQKTMEFIEGSVKTEDFALKQANDLHASDEEANEGGNTNLQEILDVARRYKRLESQAKSGQGVVERPNKEGAIKENRKWLVLSSKVKGWEIMCSPDMMVFFYFKFGSYESRDEVLEKGPWHIGSKPIILSKWKRMLKISKENISTIHVWVRFYNITLQFWDAEGLNVIASKAGKPLYADKPTENFSRVSYARVVLKLKQARSSQRVCLFSVKGKHDKCEVRWPVRPRENWVSDVPALCKDKSLRAKLIECPTSCVYAIWQERNCRTNPVEVVKVNTENNIRNRILSFNLTNGLSGEILSQ